jgi:hypothetical protein
MLLLVYKLWDIISAMARAVSKNKLKFLLFLSKVPLKSARMQLFVVHNLLASKI